MPAAASQSPAITSAPLSVRQWILAPVRSARRLLLAPAPLRWLGLTAVVIIAARVLLLSTAAGQQALLDQAVQRLESFGTIVDDAGYARLQGLLHLAPAYGAAMGALLGLVLPLAAATGIRLLSGGRASWAGALSVAGYAAMPLALRELAGLPIGLARETLNSPLTLGVLVPMLDEASAGARILWSIDLFVCWWLLVLAAGVAAPTGRRTLTVFTTLFVAYAGLGALLAGTMFLASMR